jgi:short-subunit dehydrogenase
MDYKCKTALITGASAGIGAAFAEELARRGSDLLLVARSEQRLQTLADRLAREHAIRAEVITADLSLPGAAADLAERVAALGRRVDLLVNNAGFGTQGPFVGIAPHEDAQMVSVNVAALVDLTHTYLPEMVQRKSGGVINVASTAAFQPLPYMAVYAATKAFVLSFSEALYEETHRQGVCVLALCPGATATEFFDRAKANGKALGPPRTSAQVVQTALQAFDQHKSMVIDGVQNQIGAMLPRFFPRRLVAMFSGLLGKRLGKV